MRNTEKKTSKRNSQIANQLFVKANSQVLHDKLSEFYEQADISDHLKAHHQLVNYVLSKQSSFKPKTASQIVNSLQQQITLIASLKELLTHQTTLSNLNTNAL
tara:strand:- start:425 stop:733 length:309 start_codon:yes stop_codon:yes gene_type:complete